VHASEQTRPDVAAARDAWRAEVCAEIDPARLVFLDESGVDTTMTPTYARAPEGQRALGRAPGGHWKRLTILGAMALSGLVAVMTVAAATTTDVFLAFVQQVLLPALQTRPDSIVAMDNLAPHKAACVRQAFEAAGVAYRYRTGLGSDQGRSAKSRSPPPRPTRRRHAACVGADHTQQRPGMVSHERLSFKLKRNPL